MTFLMHGGECVSGLLLDLTFSCKINQSFANETQIDKLQIEWLVLVITCLEGQFGKNYLSAFLKILKSPETNMWLLVNHTKPTKSLYWNWYILKLLRADNYKSASGQVQNNTDQ